MGRRRGAAVVELAVLLPVLILLVLGGQELTRIGLVRLKLREAARLAAWSAAARPTVDWRTGRSRLDGTMREAEQEPRRWLGAGPLERPASADWRNGDAGAFGVELRRGPALTVAPFAGRLPSHLGGSEAALALRVQTAPQDVLASFGLRPEGFLLARAHTTVRAPRALVADGAWEARAEVALIAGDWALPEGDGVEVVQGRSGRRADGSASMLAAQVGRMKFLGSGERIASARAIAAPVAAMLPFAMPDLDGTFVVSLPARPDRRRGACAGFPGFPRGALGSVVDLGPWLDAEAPRCFGSTPLRDTHEYAQSLHAQAFAARGEHFLGCHVPEADDPSRPLDEDLTDTSVLKTSCGRGR